MSGGVDESRAFRDDEEHFEFVRRGFVVRPLVDPDALGDLHGKVAELIPPDSGPFFSLYRNDGPALRRRLDEVVRSELSPVIETMLTGQRLFMGSALVKFPGDGSYLALHQDWSFVDEAKHVNGLVWLGLEATTQFNGGLHAVPGSHRFDLPFRGSRPGAQASEPVDDELKQHFLEPIDAPAGHAVVYHDALIHGSAMNRSDHPRIALVVGFVPEQADLFHFHVDEQGQKWRFRVTEEFFFDYEPPDRPDGPGVLDAEPWDSEYRQLAVDDLLGLERRSGAVDAGLPEGPPTLRVQREAAPRRHWWRRLGRTAEPA